MTTTDKDRDIQEVYGSNNKIDEVNFIDATNLRSKKINF